MYLLIPHSPGHLLKALDMILPLDSTCKNWHRNTDPHFSFDQYNKRNPGTWRRFNCSKFQRLVTLSSIISCIARGTQYGQHSRHAPRHQCAPYHSWNLWSGFFNSVTWSARCSRLFPRLKKMLWLISISVNNNLLSGINVVQAVSAGMPSESLVAPCGGYWRCSLSGLLAPPVSAMTPPLSSSLWVPSPGTTCIIRSGLYALILLVHLFLVTARCGILQVCQGKCCLRYPGGHTSTGTSGINATFIVSSLTSAESHFHAHTAFSTTPNSIFLDWWDWLWHMPLCTASSVLPPSATTMLE